MFRYSFYCGLALLLTCTLDAGAQRYSRYRRNNNTISPYLSLFRGDYFTFYRPMQQQRRINQLQQQEIRQVEQEARAARIQDQPGRLSPAPMMAQPGYRRNRGGASARSAAATFLDYSHYYQGFGAVPAQPRR